MKTRHLLAWFNARSRFNQRLYTIRALMAHDAEKHLWVKHPNDYRSKDLGYQTIAGQRVKAKRVYETKDLKGSNWIVLDDSFKVSP